MARRRTPPGPTPGLGAGSARHDLEATFRAAGLDTVDLDTARRTLLARLSSHADDFAATAALQALNRYTAARHADDPSEAPGHLRETGLSFLQRMRSRHTATTA